MRAEARDPGRGLLIAATLGIAGFILTTTVAQHTDRAIHDRAREITTNALPNIEWLAGLRTELLRTQMLAGDLLVAGSGRARVQAQLEATRSTLATEVRSYRALPRSAGEGERAAQLSAEFTDLAGALDALEAEPALERAAEINVQRVHPAIDRASDTAYALIDLHAREADDLANHIDAIRVRAEYAAFGLDTLCAFLCVLAGYLAWRTVRLYLAALESQRELLEVRATELEAFSGRVAHDILSPLGAVSLALTLIQRRGAAPDVVDRARSALGRAVRIVDALFLFAKAGAQPEPGASCEVRPVVEDALAGLADAAAAARATLAIEGCLDGEVACHPGVLASVVTNLVGNALKYLGAATERRVVVRVQPREERVRFEVEDTGSGVPPQLADRVFEPYVRGRHLHEPGIGLGLATVKKLCVAHGGSVGLRSGPGPGALFWFELPSPWAARLPSGAPGGQAPTARATGAATNSGRGSRTSQTMRKAWRTRIT